MKNKIVWHGYISIISAVLFVILVALLTLLYPGYDSRHQLMSELVFGPNIYSAPGMLLAFILLAFPFIVLARAFSILGEKKRIRLLLGFAACTLVGAGIFPLGTATELHVALVGVAFAASGLAMYALPLDVAQFKNTIWRRYSRSILILFAVSVAAGHVLIPLGIAQRLAAVFLLIWLASISLHLIRPSDS